MSSYGLGGTNHVCLLCFGVAPREDFFLVSFTNNHETAGRFFYLSSQFSRVFRDLFGGSAVHGTGVLKAELEKRVRTSVASNLSEE